MKAQIFAFVLTLLVAAAAHADTLVLKNGRRVQGTLLAVSGEEIEWEDRSWLLRRVVRVPRDQVARIEFGVEEGQAFDRSGDRDRGPAEQDPGPAIPRGMRERQVVVLANEPWVDTGIDLREGQAFYLSSGGEIRWGPRNRKDGPGGERNSPHNDARPIPHRPAAALIGRIGPGQDLFFVGAEIGPFRARQSGRLFLGINDDWLQDNSGNFRVKVSY